jgi:hypothetical protein
MENVYFNLRGKISKLVAILTSIVMCLVVFSIVPKTELVVSAAYENTYSNTGNQRVDIVAVAQTQVGYHEGNSKSDVSGTSSGSGNYTKYNNWFGSLSGYGYSYMWCQTFIAWCANQAGVPTDVVPKVSGTVSGMDFFKKQGTWQGSSYTPQSGDIIYFYSSSSTSGYHVGIVESVSGSTINTIEGNYSNKVARHSTTVGSSSIVGYGVPNYSGSMPPKGYVMSESEGAGQTIPMETIGFYQHSAKISGLIYQVMKFQQMVRM